MANREGQDSAKSFFDLTKDSAGITVSGGLSLVLVGYHELPFDLLAAGRMDGLARNRDCHGWRMDELTDVALLSFCTNEIIYGDDGFLHFKKLYLLLIGRPTDRQTDRQVESLGRN